MHAPCSRKSGKYTLKYILHTKFFGSRQLLSKPKFFSRKQHHGFSIAIYLFAEKTQVFFQKKYLYMYSVFFPSFFLIFSTRGNFFFMKKTWVFLANEGTDTEKTNIFFLKKTWVSPSVEGDPKTWGL